MGLLESLPQGLDVMSVSFLQLVELGGQGEHERAFGVRRDGWGCVRAGSGAQMFDPAAEVRVVVEEGVGDAGFALHGLEGDRLSAFDQGADAVFGAARVLASDLALAAAVRTAMRFAWGSVTAGSFGGERGRG